MPAKKWFRDAAVVVRQPLVADRKTARQVMARTKAVLADLDGPQPLSDRDLLNAINKGSFWLKLKKLRAVGFIEGPLPSTKLKVTPDGIREIRKRGH